MVEKRGKKSVFAEMMQGHERKSEIYRTSLQATRMQLFKGVFSGRLRKIILINFFFVIAFAPMLITLVFGIVQAMRMGFEFPFSSGIGLGWPAQPNTTGVAEQIVFHTIVVYGAIMLACSLVVAVGIAGGVFIFRNLLWSKAADISITDFFKGVVQTVLGILPIVILYAITIYGLVIALQAIQIALLTTASRVGWIILSVLLYIIIALITICFFWQISINANYKVNFFKNLVVSIYLTFRFIITNVIFLAIAVLPFLLFLFNNSFFTILILMLALFFSFSFTFLVWQSYAHWLFDNMFEAEKLLKNNESGERPLEVKPVIKNVDKVEKYAKNLGGNVGEKSTILSTPIMPLTEKNNLHTLPEELSILELKKLQLSKLNIQKELQEYITQHQNDEEYLVYNAQFIETKATSKEKKKKK